MRYVYYATQYEYDNWEEIHWKPITDWEFQWFEIIVPQPIPNPYEDKRRKHPFEKFLNK